MLKVEKEAEEEFKVLNKQMESLQKNYEDASSKNDELSQKVEHLEKRSSEEVRERRPQYVLRGSCFEGWFSECTFYYSYVLILHKILKYSIGNFG